ncbi:DUF6734 family protein [Roseivirga sp. BDSF3-8]|uniref:DUF6734 family protein n=1 Tax=Roseivirga sp. BDSF3-8 TaxID=3241598 RepID=UPI003531C3E5
MKIVQSFWSKPFFRPDGTRLHGGWPHRRYNYISWALSCLLLSEHYEKLEIVTDEMGKEILIDKLGLPYRSVRVVLDELNEYHPDLWALGKLYAYSIQSEPFLHVDSDIFIWKPFDARLTNAPLIAQNRESYTSHYTFQYSEVYKYFEVIPAYLQGLNEQFEFIPAINAGILGGNDLEFFKTYTSEAFNFVNANSQTIPKLTDIGGFNSVYEQSLFRFLSQDQGKGITFMFPDSPDTPEQVGFIHEASVHDDFVHCVGGFKRQYMVYALMESRMKALYPDHYALIDELIDTSEL